MDVSAQNRSLDNDYGSTHGPNSPASFMLALFMGDPLSGGVEVANTSEVDVIDADGNVTGTTTTANGYARAAVSHSAFGAASGGVKSAAAVTFPAALAEYPGTVTHWQLYDVSGGSAWDSGEIDGDGLDVTGAGAGPSVAVSIFYADAIS